MTDFNLLIDGKPVPGDLTMPVLNPVTGDRGPSPSLRRLDQIRQRHEQ